VDLNRKHFSLALAPILLLGVLASPAQAAPAAAAACAAPVASTTQPGYLVADPACELDGTPFTGTPTSEVYTGIRDGAAYRIEVPRSWNGRLVVFAHGYRGTGRVVYVDSPDLRAHYIAEGFAWAASSYQTNGYDVGQGVRDSHAMIDVFRQVTSKRARSVLMSGKSMGGHITAVAIEEYPKAFSAAMPYCGVLGDTELFDYFLDAGVTAAALSGVKAEFPVEPGPWQSQVDRMLPALGLSVGAPPTLTEAGRTWSAVVERRSGGVRPGFAGAFAYWNTAPASDPTLRMPFLFGLYPGLSGGTAGIAEGNVTGNRHEFYRSTDGWPTAAEWRLNAKVLRVTPTDRASTGLDGIPRVDGRPNVPVLSLHDIGDLFVPFSMEQVYARRAASHGRSRSFVSRAIRGVGHCDFTQPELRQAFDDLIDWVRTGHRPGGDAILNRRAVAAPDFGCRYTVGRRAVFGGDCG
jgi:hypothetical protein